VKLIIQPADGIAPLVKAIHKATKNIDIVIFRFDRAEVEEALKKAITRGVKVRALIAHTNKGGDKTLRKLELRLLDCGATVARTADDLARYHGKMMIVDGAALHVYGFNYTRLDIDKSRSFGIVTRDRKTVAEALRLFEADALRQAYDPDPSRLVVSPETSRALLTKFVKSARKQLLIYDGQVSDNAIQKVLADRAGDGVEIRILGSIEKDIKGVKARRLGPMRLHVRAIIRDGSEAFIGSQSLRKLELDGRREVGVIVRHGAVIRKMIATFEDDWKRSRKKAISAAE
jgi:phosphatidylserine/phosphatidylglycerophosphate/cardiolipin synthase-like enzyme